MTEDDFVLADTHLGHKNVHKFRTQFSSMEEHDAFVMDTWNDTIPGGSRVILAGDIAFNVYALAKLKNLPGDKVIIPGNHDKAVTTLLQFCGHVRAMYIGSVCGVSLIITHIPIHSSCGRWSINIHGHTHDRNIEDPRYINVSLEAIQYKPRRLGELISQRHIY